METTEIARRLEMLETANHQNDIKWAEHMATCEQRGKRIEEKLGDIDSKLKADEEPTTAWGLIMKVISKYGLGGAAMILLAGVLYWGHVERTQTKQDQTKKLERIERVIESLPKKTNSTP